MANNDLKTASVLAFERKLDPSDALFYSGKWENRGDASCWKPVSIRDKAVRGTISNRLKTKDMDPAKLDAEIEKANLQRVDVTALPNDCDTLKVRFTLRVLGGTGTPSACNNQLYQEKLISTVENYVKEHRFAELAKRYAFNLANGRFLWRNRIGAEEVVVRVSRKHNGTDRNNWEFNALDLSLRNFDTSGENDAIINELAQAIASGLNGDNYLLLDISAYVRVGDGQEVFPSQELILDKGVAGKGQKSKTLYAVDNVAAIHSQKIGNALRTIDTWYPGGDGPGPIAVEPYGSVTSLGKAYRQPKEKADFYTLLDNWIIKDKAPENVGDRHFVMATLVRGGVFGESGKE